MEEQVGEPRLLVWRIAGCCSSNREVEGLFSVQTWTGNYSISRHCDFVDAFLFREIWVRLSRDMQICHCEIFFWLSYCCPLWIILLSLQGSLYRHLLVIVCALKISRNGRKTVEHHFMRKCVGFYIDVVGHPLLSTDCDSILFPSWLLCCFILCNEHNQIIDEKLLLR